jgi:prolyl oligopeptidase
VRLRIQTTRAALLLTALLLATMQSQTETHARVPATVPKSAPDDTQTSCTAPPKARVAEVMDDYFGIRLADPYRWMESGGDELAHWVTRQGAYTECQLATLPGRERLAARIRNLSLGTSRITVGALAGQYRFYFKTAPGEQMFKLTAAGPDGNERVLVDPARLGGEKGHVSLNNFRPSFDGKLVACNLAEGGAEISTIHIYKTATGKELPDRIERVWGEFAVHWLPDGKRFFYTQMAPEKPGADAMQGMRVFMHVLGRPSSEDTFVLGPNADKPFPISPVEFPMVDVQPGTDWLIAWAHGARSESRLAVAKLSELRGDQTPWRKVAEYSDGIEGEVIFGGDLVLLSRTQAPNRRLLRVSLESPDLAHAQVLVPEDPDASVQSFAVTRDTIYIIYQTGGRARLRKLVRGARQSAVVRLPYEGWAPYLVTDPLQSEWYLPLVTWTRPMRIFRGSAKGFEDTGLGETSPADYSTIAVEEVEVAAEDGEKVPLTILAKKGLVRDGSPPAILTAYGGYGISLLPYFDGPLLAWLERGGVYAYAHVRGGGEKGYRWYVAGKGKNKPRGIRDFQACAEYLARGGWTSPGRLAAFGVSMGGVMVGRAITERPELFGAAVIDAGVLNALRYLQGSNGANQTAEFEATPSTLDGFKTLLAMDAYQNIKPGVRYPAVMAAVGVNDQRVTPWVSAKFIAQLQASSPNGKPALLRLEDDAGHGAGSTRGQEAASNADAWSFVLWQVGDPEFQPKR